MSTALSHTPIALILAGGLGTRLRSVVADRPKAMAEIKGRPFISYLLGYLEEQGISQVILATGFMGNLMEKTLGTQHGKIQLRYSQETRPLGTAGAIAHALPLLGGTPFLVFNGDSFCPIELTAFIQWARQSQTPASLVATYTSDASRFGTVAFDEKGRVFSFAEKQPGSAGWINAGIYFLSPQIVSNLPTDRAISLEREVFPQLLPNRLSAFCVESSLLDIGTPESYSQAEKILCSPRS